MFDNIGIFCLVLLIILLTIYILWTKINIYKKLNGFNSKLIDLDKKMNYGEIISTPELDLFKSRIKHNFDNNQCTLNVLNVDDDITSQNTTSPMVFPDKNIKNADVIENDITDTDMKIDMKIDDDIKHLSDDVITMNSIDDDVMNDDFDLKKTDSTKKKFKIKVKSQHLDQKV